MSETKPGEQPDEHHPTAASAPYLLRPLLKDAAIGEGRDADATITCVEFWEGNLYIGTSAGEVLHYVLLPSDPDSTDTSEEASFILASRLEPSPSAAPSTDSPEGVTQIVILPKTKKACIISNSVLTFHSLPELSPAVGNKKLTGCQWIGLVDASEDSVQDENVDRIMAALPSFMRVLSIDEGVKSTRKINYPGCIAAIRRGAVTCVADKHHYALLDVENQQKIPLFPISSLDETPVSAQQEQMIDQRGISSPAPGSRPERSPGGHARNTSFGSLMSNMNRPHGGDRQRASERPLSMQLEPNSPLRFPVDRTSPQPASPRNLSPRPAVEGADKPLPPAPSVGEDEPPKALEKPPTELLHPHILKPTSNEFLLTTGTSRNDPGVGMFVTTDGDVVRGTLEFGRYPTSIILDKGQDNVSEKDDSTLPEEGYILATFASEEKNQVICGIEIQRWDVLGTSKIWIELSARPTESDEATSPKSSEGVAVVTTAVQTQMTEIAEKLRTRRFVLKQGRPEATGTQEDDKASIAGDEFTQRMSKRSTSIVCWQGSTLHWLLRSSLLAQLESRLTQILEKDTLDQANLLTLAGILQNREPRSEAEFLSLSYMRQKLTLVLFEDVVLNRWNINPQISEKILLESDLDPRVIISMTSLFKDDIVQGDNGIVLHQGLITFMQQRFKDTSVSLDKNHVLAHPQAFDMATLLKRYLQAWRKRKGMGSIANESAVFGSVDAALLHLILYQDKQSQEGPGRSATLRQEIYSIVDHGVNCFERAVVLLEQYERLYALSRLYQSRRMASKVLETWKRIIEGEGDSGKEFADPENELRKYVVRIKDIALVEEYGTWLAARNPENGILVFTDDSARVKLPPNQVVQLLQLKAPQSVKVYLEHLVFGKKNFRYANELISYYLTSVLSELEPPESETRALLSQSYTFYRVLDRPKPTYRQFIAENPQSTEPWWSDRLRLLELLGGTFGTDFEYDVPTVLSRLQPYEQYLVPEGIILDGRQGHHKRALSLLCNGLGDYHTAVNYCLLGGASIFYPAAPGSSSESTNALALVLEHGENDTLSTALGLPTHHEQRSLFSTLLDEFLHLKTDDTSQRQEQVRDLLARFARWFEISETLAKIPDDWPLEIVEPFIVSRVRELVATRAETMVVKALAGAQNIVVAKQWADRCRKEGPLVQRADSGVSFS